MATATGLVKAIERRGLKGSDALVMIDAVYDRMICSGYGLARRIGGAAPCASRYRAVQGARSMLRTRYRPTLESGWSESIGT
jgi:hypothetical protein